MTNSIYSLTFGNDGSKEAMRSLSEIV